jgi:hypothetical protein
MRAQKLCQSQIAIKLLLKSMPNEQTIRLNVEITHQINQGITMPQK